MKTIPVIRSSMPSYEEYIKEIKSIWDNRWLTNMGPKHQEFEKSLLEYMKVENISLFTNGHFALESAIEALDLKGEVITTPFTFVSSTHAITRNGLTPVFCDINENGYTIDVTKIEDLITDKTSAILAVHVYGNVCDVLEIERIAKKHNLKVIYDAAHTFGETYDEKGIGSFGDISMFSFHATKVFHTIEGGALTYANRELHQPLDDLKNFGIEGKENIVRVAGNGKMNEFQAAMGICNLRHVDDEIVKRKRAAERYLERLSNIEGIKLNFYSDKVKSNYAYFPVVFDGFKLSRDEVMTKLSDNNIFARKYFYPLTNDCECYKKLGVINNTPIAKHISDRVLTLPLYADLSVDDVDRICDVILNKN